jgi:hypothetical protein
MMHLQTGEVVMTVDRSAMETMRKVEAEGRKILVGVEKTLYGGCCGAVEEVSLRIQIRDDVGDSLRLGGSPPVYIDAEGLSLVRSRGGHFTIYADEKGELYSDQ